jgi:hypothetical protein
LLLFSRSCSPSLFSSSFPSSHVPQLRTNYCIPLKQSNLVRILRAWAPGVLAGMFFSLPRSLLPNSYTAGTLEVRCLPLLPRWPGLNPSTAARWLRSATLLPPPLPKRRRFGFIPLRRYLPVGSVCILQPPPYCPQAESCILVLPLPYIPERTVKHSSSRACVRAGLR